MVDESKPYIEFPLGGNRYLREFHHGLPEEDLEWHTDEEHRKIEVVQAIDWWFQFDDEIPFPLMNGLKFEIPQWAYHRIIRGDNASPLIIIIEKMANES